MIDATRTQLMDVLSSYFFGLLHGMTDAQVVSVTLRANKSIIFSDTAIDWHQMICIFLNVNKTLISEKLALVCVAGGAEEGNCNSTVY